MNNTTARCVVIALAGISLLPRLPVLRGAEQAPSRFRHFITRQGDKLKDGETEFRFVGANMPGLVLPYDWTLYLPERLRLPTPWEQEDGFKTLDQMNLRVVRTWNLPIRGVKEEPKSWHYVLGPQSFNEEAFKTVDSLFALANKYGVRVVFDLTAEYGDYLGGIGTYAEHRGKKRNAFYTDQQIKDDFKAVIHHVVMRTNTITGVPYRDDKALLAWQFGNEMENAPNAWLSEMAAYIKSLDSNHLVAETRHTPKTPQMIDDNIDLYTRHYYGGSAESWLAGITKEVASLKGERPFFVGEFGPYIDGKNFTQDNAVDKLRLFLDGVRNQEGASGALIWSMYFHHQNGGFCWHQIMTFPAVWSYHWPGFPSADGQREIGMMQTMREAAFQMEGRSAPPLPLPDAPQLLPIGDVPLLSWRGSAGATGYDVERAPDVNGPWNAIAANVCDADVAYRPLYSDASAHAGQTWFYRVVARNASGASNPSNVVGPVTIKSVCFVDELQDFRRVQARSEGITLNNDYNALYAEHLFRAKGDANDWLCYEMPEPITSAKIVTFYSKEKDFVELTLRASADGKAFNTIQAKRTDRRLPSPPGGAAGKQRRTMVEYDCDLPADQRYLKVLWNGPAELDRVEIYHP